MQLIELVFTALTALRGNILRTSLTMLGIVIGIASVILIISLGKGATASITDQISSFGANLIFISPGERQRGPVDRSISVTTLTYEDSQAIVEEISNIETASATAAKGVIIIANGQNLSTQVNGIEPGYQQLQTLTIEQGTFISDHDLLAHSRVAVVGPEVVETFFGKGSIALGQTLRIEGQPFKIIGVTKAEGGGGLSNPDDDVYLPLTTVTRELLGQNYVQAISVLAKDPDAIPQTIDQISALLRRQHKLRTEEPDDFTVISSQEAISTVSSITGLLTTFLAAIAGISLVVGGVGIMNIMLVTVTERTKEIGLLKALGARGKDILTQFLIESIVLTLIGGLIGTGLGILFSFVISNVIGIPFTIDYSSILLALSVSTGVGVIFGLYPARKAARLNPIEALRYE